MDELIFKILDYFQKSLEPESEWDFFKFSILNSQTRFFNHKSR